MYTEKNHLKQYGKILTMVNKMALWIIKNFPLYIFLC